MDESFTAFSGEEGGLTEGRVGEILMDLIPGGDGRRADGAVSRVPLFFERTDTKMQDKE